MKAIKRTLIALALCLSSSLSLFAQDQLPTSPAFERARLVEELEHDLQQASKLYAGLAGDEALPGELQRHAALRLGLVQVQLGDRAAARVALERAAVGDDAVAQLAREALADPGDDEQRNRLLREEARRLIAEVPNSELGEYLSSNGPTRRLSWIGKAATPELIRGIEARRDKLSEDQGEVVINLAALLWRAGGPEAATYLDGLRGDEDVELRRRIVRGLRGNHAREDEMVAVAERYLADPDPEGMVAFQALGGALYGRHETWKRYKVGSILAMVDSPIPLVREAALLLLTQGWAALRHEGDDSTTMERFAPRLEHALDDVDPDVLQAAHGALQELGLISASSRALLVKRLPRLGPDFELEWRGGREDDPGGSGNSAISGLLPLLRTLGPISTPSANGRDRSVRKLMSWYSRDLERDSIETMLEANRLGYMSAQDVISWIREHCDPRDAVRLSAVISERPDLEELISWLAELELSPECWPALEGIAERVEARTPSYDWAEYDAQRFDLIRAIGRTATREAVAYLDTQLGQSPVALHYQALVVGLLLASSERPEPDVVAALLRALTLNLSESNSSSKAKQARQQVLARLTELGEPRAFELLPGAEVLGLERCAFHFVGPFDRRAADGVEWLTLQELKDDELIYFHGYDEETLASIWDGLLARPLGEPWNKSWSLLHEALGADLDATENRRGSDVPLRYLGTSPSLVRVAARHWTERAAEEEDTFFKGEHGLAFLLDIRRRKILTDASTLKALDRLHAACLISPGYRIRKLALNMLPEPLDESNKASLRLALSDSNVGVTNCAASQLFGAGQPISRELFQRMLASPASGARTRAIKDYAQLVEGGAIDLVKAKITDEASTVRAAACRFLSAQLDTNAVPELLKALTDSEGQVRTAAADALRAIRFYHEEKAFWDRVFAGTELSANSAAGVLLEQAGEQNSLEVRLLALRSLGVLGVPETLPFLIELTSNADEQIASTARAAIERIHKQGAK